MSKIKDGRNCPKRKNSREGYLNSDPKLRYL